MVFPGQASGWTDALKYAWGKQVWRADMETLRKLGRGDINSVMEGIIHEPRKALVRGLNAVVALSIAACQVTSRDQKTPEPAPTATEPRIGLITADSGDPTLRQQLDGVKQLSGRPDCVPQLIAVDSGQQAAETVGACTIGDQTQIVVRKERSGQQQIVNQVLQAKAYGEGDVVKTVEFGYDQQGRFVEMFEYDVDAKTTTWTFPDGVTQVFTEDHNQLPFGKVLAQMIAPTSAPTEVLPTATSTATPTPEPPTPTATEAPVPQGNETYTVDGTKVSRQFVNNEWMWLNEKGETILTWDTEIQKVMVYSQTKEGTMVFRMEADLGYYEDVSGWPDELARQAIDSWSAATRVDISDLKRFDISVGGIFDPTNKELGVDYTEILFKNGERGYLSIPKVEGERLVIRYYPPQYQRTRENMEFTLAHSRAGESGFAFMNASLGASEAGYANPSIDITRIPVMQVSPKGLELRRIVITSS